MYYFREIPCQDSRIPHDRGWFPLGRDWEPVSSSRACPKSPEPPCHPLPRPLEPHNVPMPPKTSAGILLYRRSSAGLEVFLIHPGGPFWAKKDSWSIPKGEYEGTEPPLEAARREFHEETGSLIDGDFLPLGTVRQPSGKEVVAWAVEGDFDPATLVSNTCQIEWPPRSRHLIEIPEADRGAWFPIDLARGKIFRGQDLLLDRLLAALA
jgi:predicted NUDIX family NTP pyrophosphohydrolase